MRLITVGVIATPAQGLTSDLVSTGPLKRNPSALISHRINQFLRARKQKRVLSAITEIWRESGLNPPRIRCVGFAPSIQPQGFDSAFLQHDVRAY